MSSGTVRLFAISGEQEGSESQGAVLSVESACAAELPFFREPGALVDVPPAQGPRHKESDSSFLCVPDQCQFPGMQPEGRKSGDFGGWECSDESRGTAGLWERSETVAGEEICGAQL